VLIPLALLWKNLFWHLVKNTQWHILSSFMHLHCVSGAQGISSLRQRYILLSFLHLRGASGAQGISSLRSAYFINSKIAWRLFHNRAMTCEEYAVHWLYWDPDMRQDDVRGVRMTWEASGWRKSCVRMTQKRLSSCWTRFSISRRTRTVMLSVSEVSGDADASHRFSRNDWILRLCLRMTKEWRGVCSIEILTCVRMTWEASGWRERCIKRTQ